ncbi:hypothetical protein QCA50_017784 [Cerrena zonata]|uniref:Uncharacterized protein n=1 Tax=Cerrena zonata TaxID=2478898 RepID=A0AAW0FEV2_9APHY
MSCCSGNVRQVNSSGCCLYHRPLAYDSRWVDVGGKRILTELPTASDRRLTPAKIGILAQFSREDFRMSADTHWIPAVGPLRLSPATATITRGTELLASVSWPAMVDGLARLRAKLPQDVARITDGPVYDDVIHLSHQTFVACEGNEEHVCAEETVCGKLPPPSEHDDLYSLFNWPTTTSQGRQALLAMKGRYKPNPLPVFDTTGRLLRPCDYEADLKGALVAMEVLLTHEYNAGTEHCRIVAHVDRIEILRKPLPVVKCTTTCRMPYELNEANAHYGAG